MKPKRHNQRICVANIKSSWSLAACVSSLTTELKMSGRPHRTAKKRSASAALSTPLARTGDKLNDDLSLFETGCFYDCTFLVSNKGMTESKEFKCHKTILATASEAFEKMLYGSFKEGKADRDDQIQVSNVDPTVFKLAMRFIYGRRADFNDHWVALQVYQFAREWMILHLQEAVVKTVNLNLKPKLALKTLTTLIEMENPISEHCLQMIQKLPVETLSENAWLEAPEEVVQKVMQLKEMQMKEVQLFTFLVKWGCAQTSDVNEDAAAVRIKIDKFIKMVRFCTMSCAEFSELCNKLIPLSNEEKFKIFHSITQHNANLMPVGFTRSKQPRVNWNYVNFKWASDQPAKLEPGGVLNQQVSVSFAIDQPHYLFGVMLNSLTGDNAGKQLNVACSVFSPESPSRCMVTSTFVGTVKADSNGKLTFPCPVLLRKGIFYKITIIHKTQLPSCAVYTLDRITLWKSPPLTVTFETDINIKLVDICGLLFA